MGVKVTVNLPVKRILNRLKRKVASPDVKREIADVIAEEIISGKSPVKGKGRFKPYSDGYAKKKGRKAPVDMIQSGDMLNSLTVTSKRGGGLRIFFKSKIAKFHDRLGAGRGKVKRRLLPTRSGEQFTKRIKDRIVRALNKMVKREVKK